MISVLRQEWKARKHTIALVSAALFIVTAIGMPVGVTGVDNESAGTLYILFTVVLVISILLIAGGVFFIPLLKGAGNIGTDLLNDRGYLLLSLPKKPVVLFTGKMIIGLAEFLIYAVPVFFYLSFSMPFAAVLFDPGNETYGEIIRKIYYTVFVQNLRRTIYACFSVVVFFLFLQTVLNLAVVLYRSFVRTRKAAFWMIVFTFIAVFAMMKTAMSVSNLFPSLEQVGAVGYMRVFAVICLFFTALYFFITIRLFEHKVEI